MSDHEQVEVYYPGYDTFIEVDKGIAPLLLSLWNMGVMTCNSCQENEPGIMWIEFYSADDAEEFVTMLIVALGGNLGRQIEADDGLSSRIMGFDGGDRPAWRYVAHPNLCREYGDGDTDGNMKDDPTSGIAMTVSVRFPLLDYPLVLDLLNSYFYQASGVGVKGRNLIR